MIARRAFSIGTLALLGWLPACEDSGEISARHAKGHAAFLLEAARRDAKEMKQGMPQGAALLSKQLSGPELPDSQTARKLLETVRTEVEQLRLAKATFFAIADLEGTVVRNDQDQDLMVGKSLFAPFPELKKALSVPYLETAGSMKEAAGVRGKPDAQWVAACPLKVAGEAVGLYVGGWSWSAYAYRLEMALRSEMLSQAKEGEKAPLIYVYMLVGAAAYGAPISPEINGQAIAKLKPLAEAKADAPFSSPLEIEGRSFGVAVVPVDVMGKGVGLAVLRSET